ncbi:hypothetical protein BST61_g4598 [Cercospora zeina]
MDVRRQLSELCTCHTDLFQTGMDTCLFTTRSFLLYHHSTDLPTSQAEIASPAALAGGRAQLLSLVVK